MSVFFCRYIEVYFNNEVNSATLIILAF